MKRLFFLLLALVVSGCHCGKLLWLGDLPDGGFSDGGGDVPPDSGEPELDAGPDGGSPVDAGVDAGTPFDDTAALRTCARVDACLLGADFGTGIRGEWFPICVQTLASPLPTDEELRQYSSLGSTVTGWFLPTPIWLVFPQVRTCLATASDCKDVVRCFNFGTWPSTCPGPNGTVSCNGSVMSVCTDPSANYASSFYPAPATLLSFSFDCATTGGTCVPPVGNQPVPVGCAAGTCSGTYQRCRDSQHAESCANGRLDVTPCSGGTVCTEAGGNAGCISATPCDPTQFHGACEHPGEVTSCVGGQRMTFPCQSGTTCQIAPNGTAFCGVANDCAPLDEIPLCENGGAIKVCSFGRWKTVSCADIGFSMCEAPDLVLRHGALCVPHP